MAVGGGRPPMPAQSPGKLARFPFCVLSIVSRVVRAQSVKSAGRIFYVHELERMPGRMPGRLSIVHELGRPSSAVVLVLCGIVRPCTAGRLQAPTGLRVAYGHMRPSEVYGACRRLLCGRGRIVSPIDVVHGAGRPRGRRRMRAPGQRVNPGSLQGRPAGRPAGPVSSARARRGP